MWDIRNPRKPLKSLNVNDYLEKRLCEVYESEAIFDKFDMQISPNGKFVLSGSYNSGAHLLDFSNNTNCHIDVKFMDKRGKNVGNYRGYRGRRLVPNQPGIR